VAFAVRLTWFSTTQHPLGTDGYYYVVQTADLVAHGRLHVADTSWVFLLHGLVGHLVDPVLATKVVAALLAALVVPAAWLAGGRDSGATVLAAWAMASPTLTHLAADFPKNLGVATPWFLLLAAARSTDLRVRWLGGAVSVGLLATAHRTGAVLAVGFVLASAFVPGQRRKALLGALVLVGLLLLVGPWLPGLPVWADRFRFEGQLGHMGVSPFAWFALRPFHPVQQLELVAVWPLALLGLVRTVRGDPDRAVLPVTAVLLALLLPVFDPTSLDLGYRVCLLTPMVAAALLPTRWPRSPAGFLLLAPVAVTGADPAALPPYDRYDDLIARIPRPLPDLLIAHQGINFLYDHRTGEEAMAWAPEPGIDPATVGRIVWGVRTPEWVVLDVPRIPLDGPYSYVRETDWRLLRERAEQQGDDDLRARLDDWRNPTRVRPWALTRASRP
jgi:hypothetical protein